LAKILVVDNDECMRELLRLHLSSAGYDVLLAEDAVVAGHLLLKRRPDLLLTDVELPYMNGLEFVRAVKSDPATLYIPVVFLTSHADAEPEALQLGAAAFLTKPVHVGRLLAAVAQHVKRVRVRAA
jgi:two-component system chemotaxis response regulator CheY